MFLQERFSGPQKHIELRDMIRQQANIGTNVPTDSSRRHLPECKRFSIAHPRVERLWILNIDSSCLIVPLNMSMCWLMPYRINWATSSTLALRWTLPQSGERRTNSGKAKRSIVISSIFLLMRFTWWTKRAI